MSPGIMSHKLATLYLQQVQPMLNLLQRMEARRRAETRVGKHSATLAETQVCASLSTERGA
jgi:hypothetical protein